MRGVPPRIVRRLVLAPLVAALDAVVVLLSPLGLLVAAALLPVFGTRPLRMVLIVAAFAARHLEALVLLLALWVRSGFGRRTDRPRIQEAHYAVMRRFVGGVYRAVVRQARVEVVTDAAGSAAAALSPSSGRPLVVLGRHAGEGDTLLVIHELLRQGRRPRVVMHEALRLDPLIDVLGSRLPNRFLDPRGGDTEVEIAAMARDLDDRSALIIFPEGANFTEERRRRGIDRLEERGHARQASLAREMRHVSAPRPGGTLAAIEAAPAADVLLMGHVGFPAGLGEVWRLLPVRQRIEVKLWHDPPGAIPADQDERIDWLFERWQRLDDWVGERLAAEDGAPGSGPPRRS